MRVLLARFLREASGAVSVDLVVLTAACVAISLGIVSSITTQADALGEQVATTVVGVEDDR